MQNTGMFYASGREGGTIRGIRMMNRKHIEEKANELTKVYSEPPIPVYKIARSQNVQVWVADFGVLAEKYSGFCDFRKGEIYLNREDDTKRRIFAAAHELGHLLFHEDHFREKRERFAFLPRYSNTSDNSKQEDEANLFARCLLLPRATLEPHLADRKNESSILAAAFDVTVDILKERREEIDSP